MKKSIQNKFADFKKHNGLQDSDIKKMIEDYANSDLEYARTYFSEKYNISQSSFYKARDFSVILCLVSNSTCQKLRLKTLQNYRTHANNSSGISSISHFDKLYSERRQFLNSFSNEEIIDIAIQYANGVPLFRIAKNSNAVSPLAVSLLIKKAIVNLLVDKNTVTSIIKNSNDSSKFDRILEAREDNKRQLLQCIETEMMLYRMQINLYDLYFRDSSCISLEDLEKKIESAKSYYNKISQL